MMDELSLKQLREQGLHKQCTARVADGKHNHYIDLAHRVACTR